jgi:hypothetical protein
MAGSMGEANEWKKIKQQRCECHMFGFIMELLFRYLHGFIMLWYVGLLSVDSMYNDWSVNDIIHPVGSFRINFRRWSAYLNNEPMGFFVCKTPDQ